MSYEIPPTWIPFIQVAGVLGIFITIIVYAVRITRHITNVEGRINQLEERINNTRDAANRIDGRIEHLYDYFLQNSSDLLRLNQSRSDAK